MAFNIASILFDIILPIFIIIGIGVVFDIAFKPDARTLSKLNFYLFVPAIVFISMLDAAVPASSLLVLIVFNVIHFVIITSIAFASFSLKWFKEKRNVLTMGSGFYNAGNYGIPFTILAFGGGYLDIIAIIMVLQNLYMFTFGLWLLEREHKSIKEILIGFAKIPVIYALIGGMVLNLLNIDLIPQVKEPLTYIADGVIPLALLTLGMQLARVKLTKNSVHVVAMTIMRLIISPIIALVLVLIFQIQGILASIMIVTSGLPVAVNTYILSLEYNQDADLASQGIFWSTLLSVASLSVLLLLFG